MYVYARPPFPTPSPPWAGPANRPRGSQHTNGHGRSGPRLGMIARGIATHVGVCAWSARVPPGTAGPHPGDSARGAAACVLAGASAEPSGRLTRGCALVATPFAVRGWTLQWHFRDLTNPAVWPAHRTGPCFNPPPAPPWSGPASRPRRSKYTNGPTLGYEYTHGKLQLARRCLHLVGTPGPRKLKPGPSELAHGAGACV